ncbi:MAG: nucleotidyl transferase AbiEii/AbiGii toxin family protein [Proteobacteria bacterium]|nr:nucleotidyl transferase AbiEii/AbiGii toxin family protein [Pseudomonadota bacterium]
MIELIQQRLDEYQASNAIEEEQAIKEIIQELALFALWRAGFFEVAAFQGGTSLRILHGLPRFSEDLDFILKEPDLEFNWSHYLEKLLGNLEEFGLKSEVKDKSRMDQAVRKAVLKDNSVSNQLNLSFYRGRGGQKQTIKLEIDVNPPSGSGFEYTYKDFPVDYEVCHQDLSSNFALKIHALLCRPYIKGRDWYDFNWYVKKGIKPNLPLLQAALIQDGPWKGEGLKIDEEWVRKELLKKISLINWNEPASDVERFLTLVEKDSLRLWNERFFVQRVSQLFS